MPSLPKILDEALEERPDGWAFTCPVTAGCGNATRGFESAPWPTKALAAERGREHFAEHKGEGPMRSLQEFHKAHGLVPTGDGRTVRVEDLP
jgi:hypothetical protein